ncbi:MAG TPA: ATP-binding protein [Flavobacterium sp.]|nr:ATP-binding protein [Flavobacterium sp.]
MRITEIKLNNYRAFYGEHTISLDKDGKNLMVYGENGSGKSSLFTALQNFFLSSVQKVTVEENIFVPSSKKNTASIQVTIKESAASTKTTNFELNCTNNQIISLDKTIIADANKIKGFFDYRSLLRTHIEHENEVDLFSILINGILKHSINRFSTKEIGSEWKSIHYDTFEVYQSKNVQLRIKSYLKDKFNPGLKQLIQDIEKDTNVYMSYFGDSVKIKLDFTEVLHHGRKNLSGNTIKLKLDFHNTHIPKHQFFLNEARLSALAISLYLASIKVNPSAGALKVLVLDDLLIGLDMSNRLPLLKILKNHFIEVPENERFQTIMTTYDKVWFELVNNYFGDTNWKFIEIYSKRLTDEDFEIPYIKETQGYLDKAKTYLKEKDNKASAVYIRTEFERIVKSICEKKGLQVNYKTKQKEFTTEDFWEAITNQTDIDKEIIKEIRIHRGTVMNPFSHYDLEHPEFTKELEDTIDTIEKLGKINIKSLKKTTYTDLKKQIFKLELQIKKPIIGKIIRSLLDK